MPRYIDLNELEKGMYENPSDDYEQGWNNALEGAMLAIEPNPDVVEVVHGDWGKPLFIDGVWLFPCSNCHYSTAIRSKEFKPCFCSNCGAKMDKRKDGDS